MEFTQIDDAESVKNGNWVVALAIDSETGYYHWYRQNSDGTWSHKEGDSPMIDIDKAGDKITDPKTANRGDYDVFIGCFKVGKNEQ